LDDWKAGLYSVDGKKGHLDADGELLDEYKKKYSLRWLMAQEQDFREEKSAMEVLLEEVAEGEQFNLFLLVSPKYHCELAGMGIELSWGLAKKFYHHLLLSEKKTQDQFHKSVAASLK
jgi:hypothetical protein